MYWYPVDRDLTLAVSRIAFRSENNKSLWRMRAQERYIPCRSFGPKRSNVCTIIVYMSFDRFYLKFSFKSKYVLKNTYLMSTYFWKCSIIEFFIKSDYKEPNILVSSFFFKPECHLQHPLCTELGLCLTKQKEANVLSAFNTHCSWFWLVACF